MADRPERRRASAAAAGLSRAAIPHHREGHHRVAAPRLQPSGRDERRLRPVASASDWRPGTRISPQPRSPGASRWGRRRSSTSWHRSPIWPCRPAGITSGPSIGACVRRSSEDRFGTSWCWACNRPIHRQLLESAALPAVQSQCGALLHGARAAACRAAPAAGEGAGSRRPDGRRTSGSPSYWAFQLGNLYAGVINGPRSPRDGKPLTPFDSDPYAQEVRRRVAESDNPALLVASGQVLIQTYADEDRQRLGRLLLERALQIDPQQDIARRLLASKEERDRNAKLSEALRTATTKRASEQIAAKLRARQALSEDEERQRKDLEEQALADLPEADRFAMLPGLADREYMSAGNRDFTKKDRAGADLSWARSKRYAQQTLALAERFRQHPDYGEAIYHAKIVLGALALREGDQATAVRLMLEGRRAALTRPGRAAVLWSGQTAGELPSQGRRTGIRRAVSREVSRTAERRPRTVAEGLDSHPRRADACLPLVHAEVAQHGRTIKSAGVRPTQPLIAATGYCLSYTLTVLSCCPCAVIHVVATVIVFPSDERTR